MKQINSEQIKETVNHSPKRKKKTKPRGVTEYSKLTTDKKRLKYLRFRDDVMSRTVVNRY